MSALTTQEMYGINFADDQDFWLWLDEAALSHEADSFAEWLENDDPLKIECIPVGDVVDELKAAGFDLQYSSCGRWLICTRGYSIQWLNVADGWAAGSDLQSIHAGS